MDSSIKEVCNSVITKLLETHNSDSNTEKNDFVQCDKATIYLLYQCLKDVFCVASEEIPMILLKATSLVDYAVEKLHAYPYKDVPLSWRRLYTDAGLLKSVCEIFLVLNVEDKNSWKQVIRTLDMALVMTGAPGDNRKEMLFNLIEETEKILRKLEQIDDQFCIQFTSPKRTMEDNSIKNIAHKKSKTEMDRVSIPIINNPLPKISQPSLVTFASHITSVNPTPFIICSSISDWPALSTRPWSNLDYLSNIIGKERIVPVEIGAKYTDETWTQKLMNFGEFIEKWVKNSTNDGVDIAYLAQHDLFAQVPRLKDDIVVPDYCFVDTKPFITSIGKDDDSSYGDIQYSPPQEVIINAWFGPKGTISPMHTDPYHNLLAQVVGQKYIRLYSPSETPKLYSFEQDGLLGNTSQVEVENPDIERFPLFSSASYQECILRPSELLYIPKENNPGYGFC
ncbi:24426_t:CDS:2 [Cetraspora pellucida]|uniref:24426_t:CDS:1 n=1 Tax=Cetraspora pellucida TaxID=1433469 RepID=A0A9N9GPU5_9GLOM|nr:24426_t:CDS:2 [Cetraspora pellucida]